MINKYILLLILVIIAIVYIRYHNNTISENFVALSGISSPLTTYDSYGTFNFLFNTNDLPFYDQTYDDMGCNFKEPAPISKTACGTSHGSNLPIINDFNRDTFIEYDGQKIRRDLIPANYSIDQSYADAKFDRNQLHLVVKKDRPRASAQPPQPHNIYFNKSN